MTTKVARQQSASSSNVKKGSALPERDRKINMTRIAMESFSNSFTESKPQDQKQPSK